MTRRLGSSSVLIAVICGATGLVACSANTAPDEGSGGNSNGGNGNPNGGNGGQGNPQGGNGGEGNPQGGSGGEGNPQGGNGGEGNPQGGNGGEGNPQGGNGGVPTTFANYQVTGSWPELKAAIPTSTGALTYTKVTVHTRFLAESCSIADYNGDGIVDVSSGRRWYEGPIAPGVVPPEHVFRDGHDDLPRNGEPRDEIETGVSDDWADYPFDVNGDGNTDIINIANCDVPDNRNPNPVGQIQSHGTAFWYQNPGPAAAGNGNNWVRQPLHGDVKHEQKGLVDVNGDGKPEIFGACASCGNTKGYYQLPDWTTPTTGWDHHAILTGVDFPFGGTGWMHGLGFGDVNGDGKPDLLSREGAFLQPANLADAWTPVSVQLWDGDPQPHRGGSHMFTADFDGDGDMDIFSAEGAHHWGLAWYEQDGNNTGSLTFTKHKFMGTVQETANYPFNDGVAFSEPHAAQVVDMDGDGVPDVVTGKMRFAHPIAENDPDALGTCKTPGTGCSYDAQGTCIGAGNSCNYVVVFKGVRDTPGTSGAFHFELKLVDAQVGVGRQFSVGQINAQTDGIMDICVATKLGLFVFLGQ